LVREAAFGDVVKAVAAAEVGLPRGLVQLVPVVVKHEVLLPRLARPRRKLPRRARLVGL
jgi:hypothetical protein